MATAYERKRLEAGVITPKRIEEAREEAQRLFELAYGAQPVRQPDGTVKMLCWSGRIDRAYRLLAVERGRSSTKPERIEAIEQGIRQLTIVGKRAMDDAQAAIDAYVALVVGAGGTPVQFELNCGCEGCVEGKLRDTVWEAEAAMRKSVWALFMPAVDDSWALPAIAMGDNAGLIQSAIEAIRVFVEASRKAGIPPDWRDSLNFSAW